MSAKILGHPKDFRLDSNGRTIWIVDAHRNDGKRLVVRVHELLTALELRSMLPGGLRRHKR